MKKNFKPLLYPNNITQLNQDSKLIAIQKKKVTENDKTFMKTFIVDVKEKNFLVSKKLDGIRCLIFPMFGLLSRSLKPIQNQNIHKKLKPLIEFCNKNGIILDGELYDHNLTFQEINSMVMTQGDVKQLTDNFKFYCFDAIKCNNIDALSLHYFDMDLTMPLKERLKLIPKGFDDCMEVIEQTLIPPEKYQLMRDLFALVLVQDFEGLIIRDEDGIYKTNRSTINEAIGFKFKEFVTDDMKIIDVVQATIVREGAEKKINETGYSVTSKKKDDRVKIESASAFLVNFNDKEFKVSIAGTDEEKKEIWANKDKYVNQIVEVKYMKVGSKDGVPRSPTTVRMRWDREGE